MELIFDNNTPIYLQLLEQFKMSIISGKYKEGEKLPSVRELAILLKVNPNTVQKALGELEDLGLIFTERTNGKYVTTNKLLIEKIKDEYAKELSKKYFDNMKKIGLNKKDIIKQIDNMID